MMRRIPIKFTLNKQKKEALINESFFLVFAFYFINKSDYDVMSNLCNVTVIVVPTSISLLTLIFALFCCASSLAIYKPNPEPPVFVLREFSTLNVRSNIRSCSSGIMPIPSSLIAMSIVS